ncbi:MAG: hypothetical protein OEX04_03515 [Acidimicrobiia bacterium]|nr:hypothetical protein [Acidimicrobiia bacterium]MDH4306525.1 hypothetical protein [Acidimicrobiia bacterium]MDH5292547.1 hypothetical protein [Acidimicrobiia bacterium]
MLVRRTPLVMSALLVAMGLALPASAAAVCGAPVVQQAERAQGGWHGLDGALVAASPSPGGVSWQARDGVEITEVRSETGVVESEGAMISAAVVVPGAPSGSIPVSAEGDLIVSFKGLVACELVVHEDPASAFITGPVVADVHIDVVEVPEVVALPAAQRPEPTPRPSTPAPRRIIFTANYPI